MESLSYLLDSNAIIDLLHGKLPEQGATFVKDAIRDGTIISVISKIEVQGSKNLSESDEALTTSFVSDAAIIEVSETVVDETIFLRKKYKLKTPDAIIAATALVFELTLITRNVKDFRQIERLRIVNPWELDEAQ